MAKQTNVVEVGNFVAGLITEASPLTFPANASLSEDNFILQKDGSRRRRLGINVEDSGIEIASGVSVPTSGNVATGSFEWRNVGGNASTTYSVVQIGRKIFIHDTAIVPLSQGLIYTKTFTSASSLTPFSFAVVDGLLVVATGSPLISSFEKKPSGIVEKTFRLLVRDMFGVGDTVAGVDLRIGSGITTRPTIQTSSHIYNLRNQTWAIAPLSRKGLDKEDAIYGFFTEAAKFPSNSDVTTYSLYPDPTSGSSDKLSDRFNAADVVNTLIGTSASPRGFFIIDALARGSSRMSEATSLYSKNPLFKYPITSLPEDLTPGGATVVAQFAGRVFYSGFSGTVTNGDDHSPRMSSYVLFSKLVEDNTDLGVCYQLGDPTSKETPDLLATDGGFIRVDGAYGIVALVPLNETLIVIATNGVWSIAGGAEYGFKATNYVTNKISDYGCISQDSVVLAGDSVLYWADNGIYSIGKTDLGDTVGNNLVYNTIQKYYDSIGNLEKASANASYDARGRKVVWTYNNRVGSTAGVKQLVLDLTLKAFYPNTLGTNKYPMVVSGVNLPPYRVGSIQDPVYVDGVLVTTSADPVYVLEEVVQASSTDLAYLVVTKTSPSIKYTFAKFQDNDFVDWKWSDGVGVDAPAHLLTGWSGLGDFQRDKTVPYATFHFNKTEDGFIQVGGDLVPTNQSSCLISPQWSWANHPNSGQWGREFQAYRFKRHYMPTGINDSFDNGYSVVSSRNKLRGQGKVLSLLIKTEPKKDCHLLGWSMLMGVNTGV